MIVVIDHIMNGGIRMETNEKISLSEKKIAQLNKQPLLETSVSLSKDGKWVIHKTIITDIKSVKYFEKVLGPKE